MTAEAKARRDAGVRRCWFAGLWSWCPWARTGARPDGGRVVQLLPHGRAFGLSDPGLARKTNEDALVMAADLGLFAVADGLGGHPDGDVASRLTVSEVEKAVRAGLAGGRQSPSLPLLVSAVQIANGRIYREPGGAGRHMGSTFTGILVLDEHRVALAHVGDSRAYRFCGSRGAQLERLTSDHAQMATVEGVTRLVITRAVGTDPTVNVDGWVEDAEPGDVFLLSTDGLHGLVGDDDIEAILGSERDLERAAQLLVAAAHRAGGGDNITLVLVQFLPGREGEDTTPVGGALPGA